MDAAGTGFTVTETLSNWLQPLVPNPVTAYTAVAVGANGTLFSTPLFQV